MANPSDSHSAGNLDPLCVHPAMILRQQRGNHRPDVVWLARSAKSGHPGNSLGDIRIIAHDTAAEIGCNSTGRNAINGDPSLAQLERSEERRVGKEGVSKCRYWWRA